MDKRENERHCRPVPQEGKRIEEEDVVAEHKDEDRHSSYRSRCPTAHLLWDLQRRHLRHLVTVSNRFLKNSINTLFLPIFLDSFLR